DPIVEERAHTPSAAAAYQASRVAHWEHVAQSSGERRGPSAAYHRRLTEIYRFLVPPGLRVLELGCGRGDLLASLEPAVGVGIDFSPSMIDQARLRHPELRFEVADAHDLSQLDGQFDVIVLSDLLHDVWDVQGLLGG